MKSIIRNLSLILILLFSFSNLKAQSKLPINNLTQEQISLLQKQKDLIKANRAKFKASMTEKQLSILHNAKLSIKERHNDLIATFTKAQKDMLSRNAQSVNDLKNQFRASLTKDQRQQMSMHAKDRAKQHDGTEMRHDVKDMRDKKMHGGDHNDGHMGGGNMGG
jgi:hypothetical protein